MVCWELITHKIPYEGKNHIQVIHAIIEGKHPKFPKGVDAKFQALVEECWLSPSTSRPDFSAIYSRLKKMKQSEQDETNISVVAPSVPANNSADEQEGNGIQE